MKKEFDWYVSNALSLLKSSNFITMIDLSYDVKMGLYFIMKIYHLSFVQCVIGSWEFVMLVKDEDSKSDGMNEEEILSLPFDIKAYNEAREEFENGRLPDEAKKRKPKKDSQPFGWLSPSGNFYVSEFGTHCTSAEAIIRRLNMKDEYDKWELEDERNIVPNDFLCAVKGYVLIHNPMNDGGYIVSNIKPLTKQQREFLYGYFADIGNLGRASIYLEE